LPQDKRVTAERKMILSASDVGDNQFLTNNEEVFSMAQNNLPSQMVLDFIFANVSSNFELQETAGRDGMQICLTAN